MAKTKAGSKTTGDYASLQPIIKNVKESVIRRRWKKLPGSSQVKVEALLRTIEQPCLTSRGQGKKQPHAQDAQVAVSDIVEALVAKLPRMPFPPGTDDTCFDFDTMINRQRVLEEQVTTNTHTSALLRAEIDAETEVLKQDNEELATLREELASLRQDSDTPNQILHPVVQDLPALEQNASALESGTESIIGIPADRISPLTKDPTSRDVLKLFSYHFDSIQKNVEGMSPINNALSSSQAALDLFNWKKLGPKDYRQIYGLDVT